MRAARLPRWLKARPYAHRGLHGPGVSENGMEAFDAAIAGGFGIECDVRLAADGVPYVFHDARAERLTGTAGMFTALNGAGVAALRLRDGGVVPGLGAMLARVAGRVPILVEVKTGRAWPRALCRAVAEALDRYDGPIAVMSFDARVGAWFAAYRRHLPRGLVISRGSICREALAIRRTRPHFLARDVRDLGSRRPLRDGTALCWTVRTGAARARARRHGLQIIFEHRHG